MKLCIFSSMASSSARLIFLQENMGPLFFFSCECKCFRMEHDVVTMFPP